LTDSAGNVTVTSAGQAYYLVGHPSDHIQHVRMTNCVFSGVQQAPEVQYVDDLVLVNVS
jgi:hypothetical protein